MAKKNFLSQILKNIDLTDSEEIVLDKIYIGKEYSTSLAYISHTVGYDERMVKRIIRDLRLKGVPICSGRGGYWIASNRLELEETINNFYSQYSAIKKTLDALKKIRREYE